MVVDDEPVTITVESLVDSVDEIYNIPSDVKKAVKDFIRDFFEDITENIENLYNMGIPDHWLQAIPDLIEYLELCLRFLGF